MDVKTLHQACVSVTVLILAVLMNCSQPLSSHCVETSCYPVTGDLLIGRADRLHASSTCGLVRPTPFCLASQLQRTSSCFVCDSRKFVDYDNPYSHTIDSIITNFEKDWRQKWWQAENGVANVYIQVDFEAEFHLTHLIMKFRTFRPAAMLIERSEDFGRTWRVYRYFAKDCEVSFPEISVEPVRRLGDVVCESRYSDVEPSTEGEVIFRVLPITVAITDPYAKEVQDLMAVTNLRVNFTALHTLGDDLIGSSPDSNGNYYYALYGVVLRGSCSCHGHASQCLPVSGQDHHPDMVHGKCECMHNTKGMNCELCADFFNDLPWRPASREKSNACKRCECNRHTATCHFDPAVYEASGHVSGGVCDDCRHNTDGQHCHLCRPFFYQDPRLSLDEPNICKPCECDPVGSLFGGQCVAQTDHELGSVAGQCTCRNQVTGTRCEFCEHGYWNLGAGHEDGCEACYCNILGTMDGSTDCDMRSGQCRCKRYVTGRHCDRCQDGYWGFGQLHPDGCNPCDCDLGGAVDDHCGQTDGQCLCRPNIVGISCTEPLPGFFFPNLDQLLYEAERANARGQAVVVLIKPDNGATVTWTGPGFMRAFEEDIIDFQIDDIPLTLNYSIVIRYDTKLPTTWDDVRMVLVRPFPVDPNEDCANNRPKQDYKHVNILPGTRHFMSSTTVCLERGVPYTLRVKLSNYKYDHQNASILIDSIVLIPDVSSISSSLTSDRGQAAVEDFLRRRCVEFQLSVARSLVPEHCLRHIRSVSALIYNGAVDCLCHPIGSMTDVCEPIGGQCHCKANVIGRICGQCAPGSHGFGPDGCEACDCDILGSLDLLCDVATGQCDCVVGVVGERCDRCQRGWYMFPKCQECQCNERADECDDATGRCIGCRFNSEGNNCERCAVGYFGDPGTMEGCQPCLCPGYNGSGVQHADSCRMNPYTREVICNCHPGYTGSHCDQCERNHFGRPLLVGGACLRCECNDNVDSDAAESCNSITGECNRCLYGTEGFHCERCQQGYYGDAVKRHNCRKCICSILGSNRSSIQCDRVTGQCPCLPHVIGRKCDRCRPLYWKLASGRGCEPCDCDPSGSLLAQCNEFDGQCVCVSGRGGRDCSQCPEGYWGSPASGSLCTPCDCDAIGSVNLTCDHGTGQCVCRAAVTGQRCDRCAPKTSGVLPNCIPCGECLDQWTFTLQNLAHDLENVVQSGINSRQDQIPLAVDLDLRRIEEKLTESKDIISSKLAGPLNWVETRAAVLSVRDNLTQTAFMVSATDSQLKGVLRRLNKAGQDINNLSQRNSQLKRDAKNLRDNATRVSEFDPAGAHQSIRESSFRSAEAENGVEASTDTLLDMGVVCNQVDDIINEFQTQYELQLTDNEEALRRVNHTFNALDLDLTYVNRVVCGGHGYPCDVLCGGGGCGKCGMMVSCQDGLVTVAADAYGLTQRADALLRNKMKMDEEAANGVRDLDVSCMEADAKASLALLRIEEAKNTSEEQINDLRELLSIFALFVSEEKASPSDVRQVAMETLQLEILVTPAKMNSLARQISKMLYGLKDVDRILILTADGIAHSRRLQQTADSVRNEAENVLKVTLSTQRDLSSAESAQGKTSRMLRELRLTVTDLDTSLRTFEGQRSLPFRTDDLRERLKNATSQMEKLKRKQSDNRVKVAGARARSRELLRLNSSTRKKLKEVNGKYKTVVQQLNNRYNQTVVARAKAATLRRRLTHLQQQVSNVTQLEHSLSAKEKTLLEVMSKLSELQSLMSDLLKDISKKVARCVMR